MSQLMPALARRVAIVAIGFLAALVVGVFQVGGAYANYLVNLVLIYAIGTLAVSMLAGLAGIWSVGHAAFLALGAYIAANLSKAGWPVEAILVSAAVPALAIGFVLGLSAGRFSILYLSILTLALGLTSSEIIHRWSPVTGGDEGTPVGALRLTFLPAPVPGNGAVLVTIGLAVVVFLLTDWIANGPRGHRWLAIKSQRLAAMSIGFNPQVENALAFGMSGAVASSAGVALAFGTRFISPDSFTLDTAVNLIAASVIGGVGSLPGALLGGAFYAVVPELARSASRLSAIVFGSTIILVLLFLPEGLVPSGLRLLRRGFSTRSREHAVRLLHDHSPQETDLSRQVRAAIGELMSKATLPLSVDGLSVQFGGVRALDDVTMHIPPGQVVGLIGPNGAGKTTLLNVLSGFVRPTRVKTLRLGSVDLTRIPSYRRNARGLGRTFQHAELFHDLSLEQTLLLTAGAAAGRRAAAGSRHLSPSEVTRLLLDGLRLRPYADTLPGELPFGIKKVVDIARMLASGAQVLLMDEPFSGLDAVERTEVRSILQALRATGVSILIIDHAVQEVLGIADQVVVLDFGRVIAVGTPDEVKNDPKVLAAYLGTAAGPIVENDVAEPEPIHAG